MLSSCGGNTKHTRDKETVQVVLLSACSKDIENHLSSYSFTGHVNEVDLNIVSSGNFQNASQFRKHDSMSAPSWKAGDWMDKSSYKMLNTP